jgi:hypothetical protein
MNLVFEVKGGGSVDFPIQTPTKLTYAVLKEKNIDKRLALIRKEIESYGWGKKDTTERMNEIKVLMNNPNLELTFI